jgi:ribonuclease HI
MELSEHIVDFKKCSAIKSQILADFVAEWTEPGSVIEDPILKSPWLVYCDGAWGIVGARAAAILISPSVIKLSYAARLQFNNEVDKCTNNIAEYEAILLGLRKLRAIGVQRCTLHIDSKVVTKQIKNECIALVKRMETYFKCFTVENFERAKNAEADELVKAATRNRATTPSLWWQLNTSLNG